MCVVVSHVTVPFLEDELALRVYTRAETQEIFSLCPAPVIVLCHGFTGVQGMLLPEVAQTFALNGFVVVTFDYRGFGESTGERGRLTVARQQEDIRVVLRWVRNNPALDERRIGLWGIGLGGGHALCVAYRNMDVCCVVSQIPVLDGRTLVTQGKSIKAQQAFLQELEERIVHQRIDGKELWVSVSRLIHDRESQQFFFQQRQAYPEIVNRMPYLTLHELCHYRVSPFVRGVHQPTLMVLAEHDHLTPMSLVNEIYGGLNGIKSLYRVVGAARYDLYSSPWRQEALVAQLAWFKAYV